ncbi:NADAR family protein [Bacillus phage vB_BanS_MrDarsey]|uniref:NADAR family protein n=1 Tax=Bacillus phage vB_BanS_MrDarsey TaxID=2894787 RepID=A0AAE8YPT3_9CAUD|nr:NADAR family protein [Bacillus phage vB_BanS_MrDarsey]UGO47941.1 NADAR family protein [Bacillus phage vB_BanS_MrDarsey]
MRETNEFIFFWMGDDVYSNFYYSPFTHQGIKFKWSEQAVMYRKAMLFGATKIAQNILESDTPARCKFWGRSREIPFVESVWKVNRERIYREVLLDKFSLPELKKHILSTGDKILVEASPSDKIWGIGLHENHRDATNPRKWRGLNLLGKVLMQVRTELSFVKCVRKPIEMRAIQWHEGMDLGFVHDKAMVSEVWLDKGAEDGRYHVFTDDGMVNLYNGIIIVEKPNGMKQVYSQPLFNQFYEVIDNDK